MGFEPTTLRDLVGCSNHWVTGTLWWARVILGLDWNRIARLHSQVMTGTHELTYQNHAVTLSDIKMQLTNLQGEYIKDETITW